jgi:hypothetical protein
MKALFQVMGAFLIGCALGLFILRVFAWEPTKACECNPCYCAFCQCAEAQ